MERLKIIIIGLLILITASTGKILIYMDSNQSSHLKAYGAVYEGLKKGYDIEWLLNYRGGSFLTPSSSEIEEILRLRGVDYTVVDGSQVAQIYQTIENSNMEVVLLEKAPKIGVYVPETQEPWDDAVRLALEYAEVPYTTLWDEKVLNGKLSKFDWLHLHHEDFTGQYGKFYASYRNKVWYQKEVALNKKMARKLGFSKVPNLKLAVAKKIKEYIASGGFVFAMCSATDTYDISLAFQNTDIVPSEFDGDPVAPNFMKKADYSRSLAFKNFEPVTNPFVYEHSDIDVPKSFVRKGSNAATSRPFTLFDFAAKYDPVPTMLTQNHVNVVKDFLGQCTAFRKNKIKEEVVILAEYKGAGIAKYIHGNYGKGTFTFYGGHDPEDYKHFINDPPTDLRLNKSSPGYRLILNNILFPAAEKKDHKT